MRYSMSSDRKSAPPPRPAPASVRAPRGASDPSPSNRSGRALVRASTVRTLATTARRAPIRVLLRPESRGPVGASLDGDVVIPVGPASRETWGDAWRPGDQEAIVWVLTSQVNERLGELRQDPRIVEVLVSMRDVK